MRHREKEKEDYCEERKDMRMTGKQKGRKEREEEGIGRRAEWGGIGICVRRRERKERLLGRGKRNLITSKHRKCAEA